MTSASDERWRRLLEGNDPDLSKLQRTLRRIPSAPRCKMCNAPFARPGSLVMGLVGWRRWPANPALCSICARKLDRAIGGAELEATFLFADIRGSTGLAERLTPRAYHELLERFYRACGRAVDEAGGLVDKYLGDGVVALFVPVFAGPNPGPAIAGIRAGRAILAETGHAPGERPWVELGVGVHTGLAYVGVMGTENGALDFTGVGDSVNAAARLGSVAGDGELLVSTATADRASLATGGLERRTLELKGREQPMDVVVLHATDAGA